MQTGDIKARYGTGRLDGFVRCNGLTIGNTGSSATERADPACQPLFEYLWPFSNITLDGVCKGRERARRLGAGRQNVLPDLRGRTIAGLDDMGATAAGRLTSAVFWRVRELRSAMQAAVKAKHSRLRNSAHRICTASPVSILAASHMLVKTQTTPIVHTGTIGISGYEL